MRGIVVGCVGSLSVFQYGSNTIILGAKALADDPYSVILKLAKNTRTSG